MEFDYPVFAGRFSPFTNAHRYPVRKALKRCQTLVVLVGSSSAPLQTHNSRGFEKRAERIRAPLTPDYRQSTIVAFDYADRPIVMSTS